MLSDSSFATNATNQENLLLNPTSGALAQFLEIRLGVDTILMLPVPHLTEVSKITASGIIPIPHMPPWVMGVYNWRGEILWLVDLGHLVGLPPWYKEGKRIIQHTVAIVQAFPRPKTSTKAEKKHLGLIVTHVEDIEWCHPHGWQSQVRSSLSSALAPFVSGYCQKANSQMFLTLDINAILASMSKNA